MRLVTWNINSLRLRLQLLRRLVKEEQPNVICLQEIKVQDEWSRERCWLFPNFQAVAIL